MAVDAIGLVLVAAAAHAGWNLVAKQAGGGGLGFLWLCCVCEVAVLVPLALAYAASRGVGLDGEAVAVMAVSGAVHTLYLAALQRSYLVADLSVAYPVTRGSGALLAGAGGILGLGERPGWAAAAGGVLLGAAVLALSLAARGGSPPRAAGLAWVAGVCVAAYTLWDKRAVDELAIAPLVYLAGVQTTRLALMSVVPAVRWPAVRAAWTAHWRSALAFGVLSSGAYLLVLVAMQRAPASVVAPLREVSVLFAAALGAHVLDESVVGLRLAAAAVVFAGVAMIAMG